jgi:succinate-semialdehyde dehydrogenase/glutarate-semialdehyde dehydrogenase
MTSGMEPDTERRNLVGGKWIEAGTGEVLPVRDPGTDELLAEVPSCGPEEFGAALDAAAAAMVSWSARTATERARILLRLHDAIGDAGDELAHLIASESGKPLPEARAEVAYGMGFVEWAAAEGERVNGDMIPSSRPEQRILVTHAAIGVTAAITPWNFPLAMITRKLAPALAVGCTQVIKPAPQTPLTALALGRLAVDAGVPAGVLNIVTGPAADFADAVFADARVRKVSFTGSTAVGQELVRRSAHQLTRLSLELGGHAPVIVLDDADLDVAVTQAMRAKFRNTGQSCIAANRFYVARPLYDDFCDAFSTAARDLRVGHWSDDPDIGPLISDAGVAKVRRHVEDAVDRGAKLVCGGGLAAPTPGRTDRYFEPTVVIGATGDMLVMREETFGPLAAITAFDSDDEAIASANDTPYGLAGYVFGRDMARVLAVVDALECGVIGVNDGVPSTARAPFGGMKMSGVGREGGRYVMGEYLETKYVSLVL